MNRRDFLYLTGSGILGSAIGCSESRTELSEKKPHIVCVLIDQLRKDYADKWSTRLTELSMQGVRFENMRSVAPWTYPSVISMMSGLYPQQHGADGHLKKKILTHFSKQVPFLQGTLKNLGYKTAAFITNPFLHTWNHFHRDFDFFDAHFIKNCGNIRASGRQFSIPEEMFSGEVNSSVKKFFLGHAVNKPEFTYIHYIDVHGPWRGAPFKPDYVSSVKFMDERIEEIYRFFMERYNGNVLFVVTSDHGVSLGDDLMVGYGKSWRKIKHSCHDFNLRIPFSVLPSEVVKSKARVNTQCSNVDLVPTILDLLGAKPEYNLVGRSPAPWIRGESAPYDSRPIYSKVSAFGGFSDSLIYTGIKLIRYFNFKDKRVELTRLFDTKSDPRETKTISSGSEVVEEVIAECIARESGAHGLVFAVEDNNTLPEDTRQKLRSLGYLK